MKLSPEEKAANARQKMLDKACEMASGTYCRKFVAPLFQSMIRAEAAAEHYGWWPAVIDGTFSESYRDVGQCVCITCGRVYPWKGTNMLDTGHFIASRRNSILLVEDNAEPQCKNCNRDHHGRPLEYRIWMLKMRGQDVIDRLQKLKTQSVTFSRDELVSMRIEYSRRLKAAELKMKSG